MSFICSVDHDVFYLFLQKGYPVWARAFVVTIIVLLNRVQINNTFSLGLPGRPGSAQRWG